MLDESDKTALLDLAKKTLKAYFDRRSMADFKTDRPDLLEPKGAFVSLHIGKELRGCIGQLDPEYALFKVVQQCTLSAAFSDPRFVPVRQDELTELDIEISVLTPFRRIQNAEEVTVGKHGLYIVRGHCRGLLLPQVAQEYGWDRTTFLMQTCHKAGLPASAWEDPQTEIFIFEAEVFSDLENSPAG